MESDFRRRVLVPIALPVVALLAIIGTAFSLSRVLLTVPGPLSVFIALGVAAYVLFVAFLVERRPRITSRALAVGTTLALVGVIGAGLFAAAAGPREPEEGDVVAEGEGQDAAAPEVETVAEVPEGAVLFAAGNQIAWSEAPETMPSGPVTVALQLEGGLAHNVSFEALGDEPVVAGDVTGVYTGEVELEPGEYVYYCSVPGHRSGMEGTVTVE